MNDAWRRRWGDRDSYFGNASNDYFLLLNRNEFRFSF